MYHDFNNLLFKHLSRIIEILIRRYLKGEKLESSFAADTYNSQQIIYDTNRGNELFARVLKESYDYLKGKNKLKRLFTELMITY